MRLKGVILLLFSVFCVHKAFAQAQGELTQSRILILLDESSSMVQPWAGGLEKYKAADSIILRLMDSVYQVNPDVEFSLRVFGHQHTVEENNCLDTKNEVPFSKDNRTQMAFRLADIRPLGVTPIAYALEQAAEYDLADETRNAYSIILITDGGESCGGDICDVMRKLIQKKVFFKPYIVSLEDYAPLRSTYSCMGDYLQVTRKSDISPAVSTIVAAFRPALKMTKSEYKQLQTIAISAPSSLKMNIPVRITEPVDNVTIKPTVLDTERVVPIKTFSDNTIPKQVIITKPAPKPIVPAQMEAPKDTIVAAPKPPHHITLSDAPSRPPARKIALLSVPLLKSINIAPGVPGQTKLVMPALPLPPVVSETIVHKIAQLDPASLRSISIVPGSPAPAKTTGIPLSLPAIVSETVVQKITPLDPAPLKYFSKTSAGIPEQAKIAALSLPLPAVVSEIAIKKIAQLEPAPLRSVNAFAVNKPQQAKTMAIPLSLPAVVAEVALQKITQLEIPSLKYFSVPIGVPEMAKALAVPLLLPPVIAEAEVYKLAQLYNPSPKAVNIPPVNVSAKAKLLALIPLPSVVTEEVVVTHKVARLDPAPLKLATLYASNAPKRANIAALPLSLPPIVAPEEFVTHKVTRLQTSPLRSFSTYAANAPKKAKIVEPGLSLPAVISDSVISIRKIARLKSSRLKTFNVLFVVEDRIFSQRKIPALPAVNFDNLVQRIDSKIPIPLRQPVPPGKKGGYTVETEDAKETSLEIYFTDGMGKFYPSTPQMILVDPLSKKILKKFYRTIDANGNPDPQNDIPVGTYDIAVAGSRSLIIHDVDIVKDKKNKLVIKIKKCSLKFAYIDAPTRPVKEFIAQVTERDKMNGNIVTQKCTEELLYEPGNYHIDINTFPADVRNVDLDLDDETVISIAQPGFAKFTSEVKTRVVALYAKRGEHYLNFYSLNLDDPKSQHLQIQPGEYQAHYQKGSGNGAEKVVPFIVRPAQETEVILK